MAYCLVVSKYEHTSCLMRQFLHLFYYSLIVCYQSLDIFHQNNGMKYFRRSINETTHSMLFVFVFQLHFIVNVAQLNFHYLLSI